MQNLTNRETLSTIRHIWIHVLAFPSMITFLWTLGPSLSSVKWTWKNGTWTVLAFWTNGRSSHATVTGLQPSFVKRSSSMLDYEPIVNLVWMRSVVFDTETFNNFYKMLMSHRHMFCLLINTHVIRSQLWSWKLSAIIHKAYVNAVTMGLLTAILR